MGTFILWSLTSSTPRSALAPCPLRLQPFSRRCERFTARRSWRMRSRQGQEKGKSAFCFMKPRWIPKGSAIPACSVYVDVDVFVNVIVDEVRRPNIDHGYVDVHVHVHDQVE